MRKIISITLTFILLLTTLCLPTFASSKSQLSDVNLDGEVSIVDAKLILQAIVGLRTLTEEQNKNADVNKDNELSILDAKWVLQIIVGLREIDEEGNVVEVIPDVQPSEAQFAYYTASTGEKIRYCSYVPDCGYSKGISEKDGVITLIYGDGTTEQWFKCDNCGKYLCEGCQPESDECYYCGRTDCLHFTQGGQCPYCGVTVGPDSCHYCPNI